MTHYRLAALAFFAAAVLSCRAPAAGPPADAYGDPLPPGAVARLGSVRPRHTAMGVAWAADGKTFVSARSDGTGVFLAAVPAGKYRVEVDPPSGATKTPPTKVPVLDIDFMELNVKFVIQAR